MIKLLTFLLISISAVASPLVQLTNSFSKAERELLLEEHKNSSSYLHTSNSYSLKKGWNILTTPKDGIDIVKTFSDSSVFEYVVTYDEISTLWAMNTQNKTFAKDIILSLEYLEPNITFFVLAKKDIEVKIQSLLVSESCKKIMQHEKYDFIVDSGITREYTVSEDKNVSLKSRYYSHNEVGIYSETRTMLIYPKITSKTKRDKMYGPAKPKIELRFTSEYEGKKFFVYDFKEQKCFMGVFPSKKIPPYPTLREI